MRNTTLLASWAVAGPRHRVFFGGDTGYTAAFADVGARLGPFDLAMLPVGAYSDLWPEVVIGRLPRSFSRPGCFPERNQRDRRELKI